MPDYIQKALDLGPAVLLSLGDSNGLSDLSGNGRNGTAAGGVSVGTSSPGPLTYNDAGATDFDGTDDRITTTYSTRRNYILNPSFEVDANNYGQAGSSRTNLIPNPSLETGITGWSALAGSSVWSTDAYIFGTNAFKSVSTGSNNRVYSGPIADATAGTTYTASGYGRTEESGRTGKVMIRFFDSGGTILQSTDGTTSSYTASTWQRFSATATAPAGTAKVGMALYWDAANTASSGQVCYADAFLIETGSTLRTYFPNGTQLADPNIGITWAGTAHASASTWSMKVTRTSAQSVTGSYSGYVTTNGQSSNGISAFSSGAALPAGRTWTASCYVKADTAAIGQTLRFTVAEVNAGSAVGVSYTDLVLTGAWQRVSVTRTFTTGTDFWAYATLSGVPAAFWVDGYMFEEASSVGSLFPTETQLANGEAGWTGTPHASYSDIGCFANGTSRTFIGWFNRDALGSSDVLFGGTKDATGGIIRLTSANFLIVTDGTNAASFSPKVTTVGEWMHIAVVIDEPGNLAYCYINGQFYDDATMSFQYPAAGSLIIGAAGTSNPFDGKMAGVSIYERALSAGEIRDLFLSSAGYRGPSLLTVAERPPLRESVVARTPAGKTFRWGEDAWDAADRPDDVSYGSSMPGGYSTFSATLPRIYQSEYPDLPPLTELTVIDGAGSIVGEYYLERASRRSGESVSVSPEAVGFQNMLADEKNVNWLGVDADLSAWAGATAVRKVWQNAFNVRVVDGALQEGQYDGIPGVEIELVSPWAAAPSGEAYYQPPSGTLIGSIYYAFYSRSSVAANPLATYTLYVSGANDPNLLAGAVNTADLYTVAAGSGSGVLTLSPAKAVGYVRWAPPVGANATDGATYTARFTRLSAVGDHGLAVGTSLGGGPSLLASDVIKYLVRKYAPLIQVLDQNVGTTDLQIPHSRGDQTTVPDLISEHNKYHLWDWAVWEKKRFYYQAPGAASVHRTWRARVGPSNLEDAGRDVRRVRNGVYVRFTDTQGVQRMVGPSGSQADYTTSDLNDTDPANEANQAGRRMYDVVEMRGVSETQPAVKVGRAYLALMKQADRSGSATLNGYVQEESGAWYPHTSVRAGDTVRFVDASDSSPRRISEVTHTRNGRTSSITLDAPPEGLEAVLDRLSLSLVGTGLS